MPTKFCCGTATLSSSIGRSSANSTTSEQRRCGSRAARRDRGRASARQLPVRPERVQRHGAATTPPSATSSAWLRSTNLPCSKDQPLVLEQEAKERSRTRERDCILLIGAARPQAARDACRTHDLSQTLSSPRQSAASSRKLQHIRSAPQRRVRPAPARAGRRRVRRAPPSRASSTRPRRTPHRPTARPRPARAGRPRRARRRSPGSLTIAGASVLSAAGVPARLCS